MSCGAVLRGHSAPTVLVTVRAYAPVLGAQRIGFVVSERINKLHRLLLARATVIPPAVASTVILAPELP
jgi:hypothetical protein